MHSSAKETTAVSAAFQKVIRTLFQSTFSKQINNIIKHLPTSIMIFVTRYVRQVVKFIGT